MGIREKHFSFAEIIGWVGGTSAAAVLATWTLAVHLQSNELASYKAAEGWKPLETITQLRKASESVNLAAAERNELVALRAENRRLRSLVEQVPQLTAERDRLATAMAAITQDSVEVSVAKGGSQFLIKNVLLLGVVRAYSFSNECEFTLGNREESLKVGKGIGTAAAGNNYQLRLTGVTDTACSFSFVKVS